MTTLIVLGGTGYAGSNILAAAAARGLRAVSYSRSLPQSPIAGVEYRTGDLTDAAVLASAL
ncbi:MAG: NAD-dependent epimerase/dehydratase family protein, partial [Nocardioides sp.]